jgi:hypothetical protein
MPNYISSEPQEPSATSLQGQEILLADDDDRREAFENAFDYRGDVTLILTDGETVEGFLFNREPEAKPPSISLLLKGSNEPRVIAYAKVDRVFFSGRDTADGKSYDAWKAKKQSERDAEAKRIEDEMKAQGLL